MLVQTEEFCLFVFFFVLFACCFIYLFYFLICNTFHYLEINDLYFSFYSVKSYAVC